MQLAPLQHIDAMKMLLEVAQLLVHLQRQCVKLLTGVGRIVRERSGIANQRRHSIIHLRQSIVGGGQRGGEFGEPRQ